MYQDKSLYLLLSKIFDMPRSLTGKKEKYNYEDIFVGIEDFEQWLLSLKKEFSIKKKYTNEHLAEHILIYNKISKQTCKYHILAIEKSISIIKQEIKLAKDNAYPVEMDYIKGKLALLRDILLDSYELVGKCESFFLEKPPSFELYRSRLFTSNEIFNSSENLLRRYFYYTDNTHSSASVFLIRQAIETKILNSLGIYNIVDYNNEPAKFKFEKLVEFITKNKNIEFPIQKSLLLKIAKWTNVYIHRGIMQYHWQIIIVHEVLKPLFSMGEGKTMKHLFGAVKLKKEYFENDLYNDILIYLDLKDYKINKIDAKNEAIIE